MGKNKSKKKKKPNSTNYKLFAFVGALFHLIVYFLYDKTFYNGTLFWVSAGLCGLFFGIFFIKNMNLLNPKSYRKIDGIKLKLYMSIVCIIMVVGGVVIFGSVINGTILGLNYIGKNKESSLFEYQIEKITQNRTTGGRKRIGRNNPLVYLERDGELISVNLSERYSSDKNYSEFKTIEFELKKGLFGFYIIDKYELRK